VGLALGNRSVLAKEEKTVLSLEIRK
jgi:hypothetical protein